MALIKFILIVLLVYYIFKFAGRYLFPYLLNYFIKKAGDGSSKSTRKKQKKKEGEVSIDYMPRRKRKLDSDRMGEYIDFEEIDNNHHEKKTE